MFRFSKTYLFLTVLLFAIETAIALFVHDNFIRPYFGDVLVVILIYCFVKSFLDIRVFPAVAFVLLFAFCIESMQYFNFVETLHLEKSNLARTVLGNSFAWEDIIAYIGGVIIVIVAEKAFENTKRTRTV
jgi:hypothetical protein